MISSVFLSITSGTRRRTERTRGDGCDLLAAPPSTTLPAFSRSHCCFCFLSEFRWRKKCRRRDKCGVISLNSDTDRFVPVPGKGPVVTIRASWVVINHSDLSNCISSLINLSSSVTVQSYRLTVCSSNKVHCYPSALEKSIFGGCAFTTHGEDKKGKLVQT